MRVRKQRFLRGGLFRFPINWPLLKVIQKKKKTAEKQACKIKDDTLTRTYGRVYAKAVCLYIYMHTQVCACVCSFAKLSLIVGEHVISGHFWLQPIFADQRSSQCDNNNNNAFVT